MNYCLNCLTDLLPCDDDPNGEHNCICVKCRAEEEHDFDVEPNVEFDRYGNETVDGFIKSLEYNKVYTVPSNMTWHDLEYSARYQHSILLVTTGNNNKFMRICPCCGR